ncbi:MAG: hypothetical protein NTAFB01_25660 [Nitrospira sp.]
MSHHPHLRNAGVLYWERFRSHPEIRPFRHTNWTNCENKVVWIQQAVEKLKRREWFWIDERRGRQRGSGVISMSSRHER